MALKTILGYKIFTMNKVCTLKVTAIAFDLGNVLVRVDHGRFCRALAELAGRSADEVFAATFASDLEPAFDTGGLTPEEFYRRVMARLAAAVPYPLFCRLWNEIFDPMDGMEEVVAHLGARYRLFMLSNTNALHYPYIRENFPIVRHFPQPVLSFEVGSRKPEAGIFQALVARAGEAPERILFVDDKLIFVEAARAQGLCAWQFVSPAELKRQMSRHGLW